MGTVVTIDLFGEDHLSEFHAARSVDAAERILREVDEVFSTWKPQSPLSRLRRGELTIAEVPAMVADVLDECRTAKRLSRGWFDPWSMPGGVDPTGLVKGWRPSVRSSLCGSWRSPVRSLTRRVTSRASAGPRVASRFASASCGPAIYSGSRASSNHRRRRDVRNIRAR